MFLLSVSTTVIFCKGINGPVQCQYDSSYSVSVQIVIWKFNQAKVQIVTYGVSINSHFHCQIHDNIWCQHIWLFLVSVKMVTLGVNKNGHIQCEYITQWMLQKKKPTSIRASQMHISLLWSKELQILFAYHNHSKRDEQHTSKNSKTLIPIWQLEADVTKQHTGRTRARTRTITKRTDAIFRSPGKTMSLYPACLFLSLNAVLQFWGKALEFTWFYVISLHTMPAEDKTFFSPRPEFQPLPDKPEHASEGLAVKWKANT